MNLWATGEVPIQILWGERKGQESNISNHARNFSANFFIPFHPMDFFIVLWDGFSNFDECFQKQRQEVQLQYYCGVDISPKPVKIRPPKNTIPALKETKIQELAGGGASSSVWIQRLSHGRSERNHSHNQHKINAKRTSHKPKATNKGQRHFLSSIF